MLTSDSKARKEQPIARGVLDYFPDAIACIANVSYVANKQHNGDAPMHWAREKSTDHADCIARHLIDRGRIDSDGLRHSAKIAWRALALLQEELEREGHNETPVPGDGIPSEVVEGDSHAAPKTWKVMLANAMAEDSSL
jgi:hypothetical protein